MIDVLNIKSLSNQGSEIIKKFSKNSEFIISVIQNQVDLQTETDEKIISKSTR
jgi:hypothetical protein